MMLFLLIVLVPYYIAYSIVTDIRVGWSPKIEYVS